MPHWKDEAYILDGYAYILKDNCKTVRMTEKEFYETIRDRGETPSDEHTGNKTKVE